MKTNEDTCRNIQGNCGNNENTGSKLNTGSEPLEQEEQKIYFTIKVHIIKPINTEARNI